MTTPRDKKRVTECPHPLVRFCPLYHASHGINGDYGHGCDDGRMNENNYCGVSRRIEYDRAVAILRPRHDFFLRRLERDEQLAFAALGWMWHPWNRETLDA